MKNENDNTSFFAPSRFDAFDVLIDEYDKGVSKLKQLHTDLQDNGFLTFLVDGYSRLLSLEESITAYRSYMWQRAMKLTDVLDFMPTVLREAWTNLIETGNGRDLTPRLQLESGFITDINNPIKFDGVPEFTEDGVRATIGALMHMRGAFLTSMVDGIFFHLSGEHVTNRPEGFSKRFIVNNVYNQNSWGIDFNRYSNVSYIHDLRFVIGKLLKRNPIRYGVYCGDSGDVIKSVISEVGYGKWGWIDGNAIKIRCYMKGTVHIELHPELTWQLNAILANKYPNAIPSKFTKRVDAKRQERVLFKNVIDERVINAIRGYKYSANVIKLKYGVHDKWLNREIDNVMILIGGVPNIHGEYKFSYDSRDVINNILTNRVIPDQKSHQFYPSPESVVSVVCDAVSDIDGVKTVCEPSCGTGNIMVGLLNKGYDLTGYEISPVFAEVAQSRIGDSGSVITGDFLDIVGVRYDTIAMNPPFDQGRWLEHVRHAVTLSDNVIAVLPEGANCDKVGVSFDVVQTVENAFENTSINVKVVHFYK